MSRIGPYSLKHWQENYANADVELRCDLQDNRLHSGEEVDDPREYWDSVLVKGRYIPHLLKHGLLLEYVWNEDDHHAFQSQDLFITELLAALDELKVPYKL